MSEPFAPADPSKLIRKFDTGATRSAETGKYDYEGFLAPIVVERFAAYMHKHRVQPDGSLRDADNWQKGIELKSYMKSGWRHFFDWWKLYRGLSVRDITTGEPVDIEEACCALLFNVMGFLFEILKSRATNRFRPGAIIDLDAQRQFDAQKPYEPLKH